jgi:hypothetical protein
MQPFLVVVTEAFGNGVIFDNSITQQLATCMRIYVRHAWTTTNQFCFLQGDQAGTESKAKLKLLLAVNC